MNKELMVNKIRKKFGTNKEFAVALGISEPSVSEWFKREIIPSARLKDVFSLLDISEEKEQDMIMGIQPLELAFRSKKDLKNSEIPINTLAKVEKFAGTYFSVSDMREMQILSDLRQSISGNFDVEFVTEKIRDFFGILKDTPFSFANIDFVLKKCGINVYFIPFKSFGFNNTDKKLRALTAKKENQFLVLCDSDRTFDEVMFDLIHELVHIFTSTVSSGVNKEIEDFIDSVTERLIYPKEFLLKEFPFLNSTERLTPLKFMQSGLRDIVESFEFYSPRGLAKALKEYGYVKKTSSVYIWLSETEHSFYLKYYGKTLSEEGSMQFDFSDTFAFEDFINDQVMKDVKKFPLFFNLAKALITNKITPRAFANLFDMNHGDVNEMRKLLANKYSDLVQGS